MGLRRTPGIALLAAMLLATGGTVPNVQAAALGARLVADLDGRPIVLGDVGQYACHDLDYPRIHCFTSDDGLRAAVGSLLAASTTNYVVIFENSAYSGAYMYVSQNYTALAVLGWNDRISSFKALNSEAGTFYVDWFYGGSAWGFCCNSNVSSLGAYNDTFSSVVRS